MNFSVIIPARYQAQRLPGKPLREIHGKPLIQWVVECARRSSARDIIVATDDPRVARVVEGFDAQVCLTAGDHASGTDRLAEVVQSRGYDDDHVVVNLQGDEPLMPAAVIDQVAGNLLARPETEMATVCSRIRTLEELFDPHVVKVVSDASDHALYFSRAAIPWDREEFPCHQQLPVHSTHFRHIGLYAYRAGFLARFVGWSPCPLETTEKLEQLRALYHGARIHVAEAVEEPGPGVDTETDLLAVAERLQQGPHARP